MKTYLVYFLSISILYINLSSCKKDPKILPTYYLDQETKDYTHFSVGSYWIYKDSISGQIDSTNCITQETTFIKNEEESAINEFFWQEKYHSFNDYTKMCSGTINDEDMICAYAEGVIIMFYSNKPIGFKYKNYLEYISYSDSLQIQNKWYYSVKEFKNIADSSSYYFSKNIGLIKKIENNYIWELTNYKIN